MTYSEAHWAGFHAAANKQPRDESRGHAWLGGYDRFVKFVGATS